MSHAWEFAITNPGYTFLLFWCFCWMTVTLINRFLRHMNIRKHGWPTPPIDADGDVVLPKAEE